MGAAKLNVRHVPRRLRRCGAVGAKNIRSPALKLATISELSTFADIAPGDVLLTGTPSGCALHVPPSMVRRILQLLPERRFWKPFVSSQLRRANYLRPGDAMTATNSQQRWTA
jgi:Fumarylacetoacetate (FAA) hydrolase family